MTSHSAICWNPNEVALLIEAIEVMVGQELERLKTAEHGPIFDGGNPVDPETAEDICATLMDLSELRYKLTNHHATICWEFEPESRVPAAL